MMEKHFMGPRAKELADELYGRRDEDGGPVIFDGGIAPAVLVSDGFGGLFATNHNDDEQGKAALVRRCASHVGDEAMHRGWQGRVDDEDSDS